LVELRLDRAKGDTMKFTPHMRSLLGSTAITVLGALMPISAYAQAAADEADKEVEELVVVGTNISGVKPVGAEAVVIDSVEIERSGYSNAADLLRTLPQVQTGGVDPGGSFQGGGPQNSAYASAGAETVGLRGLGAAATLVLIDGRRALSGGAAVTNTDANQVPLAALQRIEVLTDGASALYGSDAVGGVINFVLRKDGNLRSLCQH
jgi:iron complex outermembrane recepter protein